MHDTKIDNGVAAGMEQIRKSVEEGAAKSPALSEAERFMASVSRQREGLRNRMLTNESAYQMARATVVNEYWLRFQNLQHELDETLRELDHSHEKQLANDRKLFNALDAARDA